MSTPIHFRMRAGDWAALVTLSVLWGGSFFFVEIALRAFGPLTVVSLRVGLAAVVLWAVAATLRLPLPRTVPAWGALATMGVLNNVLPFSLIAWGQTGIGASLASILNATTPLFTAVVAGIALPDERITRARLAGAVAGLAGVAAMLGPAAAGAGGSDPLCQAAVLAGALSYACAGVFGRRFRDLGIAPLTAAAGQVTTSALLLAPAALLSEWPPASRAPDPYGWAAVAALAVLSTALAYVLYFRILERAGANNLLLVTFLIPISAIVLGIGVLGERLEVAQVAGATLVGLALVLVSRPGAGGR